MTSSELEINQLKKELRKFRVFVGSVLLCGLVVGCDKAINHVTSDSADNSLERIADSLENIASKLDGKND